MGIFRNLFNNNQNKPVDDPYFDVIYSYFSNGSDDFDVDDKGVINVSSDIYAITSRIANDISNKPIKSTNSYVADLLNNHINNQMNAHDWKVATLMNLLIYGDSFSLIQIGSNNTINSIDLLPTYEVTVLQNGTGLKYQYNNQVFNDDQVLHFKLNSINGLTGTSPLLALKNILKLSRSSNRLLEAYYSDTAFNKTLLQADGKLNANDREKLKNAFQSNLGADHAGGTIVSDDTVTIKPFNTTNVGANIIKETKNADYFAKKIASVYKVPASLLGVVNSHANTSDTYSQYRIDLKSYENIIVSELNNKLNGVYTINDAITPITATDVANLVKAGAISSVDAKNYLGINN